MQAGVRDTNLLSGEAALQFCLVVVVELQKQNSELARTLAEVLGSRIQQRRKVHAAVLQYLHSNTARQTATEVFTIPSNDNIRKFIRRLITRLDSAPSAATSADTSDSSTAMSSQSEQDTGDSDETASEVTSVQQKMEMAMRQSLVAAAPCQNSSFQDTDKKLDASIKAEMVVFTSGGKRGRCLEQAYEYLLSIPPTSVEAERAFSAAGVLCTKLRSRLDDRSLDTLCFLRSYYKRD